MSDFDHGAHANDRRNSHVKRRRSDAVPECGSSTEAERLAQKWLAASPAMTIKVELAGAMLRDALHPTAGSVPSAECGTLAPGEVGELIERLRRVRKTNPFAGHGSLCEYAADVLVKLVATVTPVSATRTLPMSVVNDPTNWNPSEEFDGLEFASYTNAKKAEVLFNRLVRERDDAIAARSTSGSSVGWLIENGKVGSELRYRTMVEGLSAWTADHQEALRFCRREDAERFAADDDGAWLIYQHMWHDRPSVPSARPLCANGESCRHPDRCGVAGACILPAEDASG